MPDPFFCLVLLLIFAVGLHRISAGMPLMGRLGFADLAAALVSGCVYAFFLLSCARPLVALGLCLLLLTGLWCVNAAKIKALRGEPLVFSDAALAWQVVRFPRLYLPFLPCKRLLAGALVSVVGVGVFWRLIPPSCVSSIWFLPALWPVLFFLFLRSRCSDSFEEWLIQRYPLEFSPQADARRYGPLGAALLHVCWHLTLRGRYGRGIINITNRPPISPPWPPEVTSRLGQRPPAQQGGAFRLPNLFLVQAESFCDPRRFCPLIPPNILSEYDLACTEGVSGYLGVGAFGAYTMRTEFAVLTGQLSEWLGTDAFHPYWSASRHATWSLARYLRDRGYRTVCVHPFYREFFFRNQAIPNLGFEEFVSLEGFLHQETFGPYVSDIGVAQSMLELLDDARPVFCFAITMENHGPWRKGRFSFAEEQRDGEVVIDQQSLAPQVCRYLRHLRNADAMIGMLRDGLRQQSRPGILGWYGDHLPNLPMLVPEKERDTPYFIWTTENQSRGANPTSLHIRPESLGGLLLQQAAPLV